MMIPFQIDPLWYEQHWWREQPRRRRSTLSRLIPAAALVGRFLWSSLRFLGIVLVLIVSGDFRLPRCDHALEPADQCIEPDSEDRRSTAPPDSVPMPQFWE
jgi:hypothetical protein